MGNRDVDSLAEQEHAYMAGQATQGLGRPVPDEFEIGRDPGVTKSAGGLIARVDDGALIPPWHGAVRFDMAAGQMITAVFPLSLIGRFLHRIYVNIKLGHVQVHIDPRAAFHDGLLAGEKEALENMPQDLKLQRALIEGEKQVNTEMARRFGETAVLHRTQEQFDQKLREWISGTGETRTVQSFPFDAWDEINSAKLRLKDERTVPFS